MPALLFAPILPRRLAIMSGIFTPAIGMSRRCGLSDFLRNRNRRKSLLLFQMVRPCAFAGAAISMKSRGSKDPNASHQNGGAMKEATPSRGIIFVSKMPPDAASGSFEMGFMTVKPRRHAGLSMAFLLKASRKNRSGKELSLIGKADVPARQTEACEPHLRHDSCHPCRNGPMLYFKGVNTLEKRRNWLTLALEQCLHA
jgi:hypothetical protein